MRYNSGVENICTWCKVYR